MNLIKFLLNPFLRKTETSSDAQVHTYSTNRNARLFCHKKKNKINFLELGRTSSIFPIWGPYSEVSKPLPTQKKIPFTREHHENEHEQISDHPKFSNSKAIAP